MRALLIILLTTMALVTLIVCAKTPAPKITGNYCIDVNGDSSRVEEAFGYILNLKDASGNRRPATTAEIETAIFDWVEGQTNDYERRKNMAEFTPPPFGSAKNYHASPTPTPAIKASPVP